ncbi:MAG TPA: VWA domain-containing protein [Candidatus Baltobacteraceae bacterium]|jgi:Ca-activated chloride channel family protein
MTFAHPLRLLAALVAVLAFYACYRFIERRKTGSEIGYSNLPFLVEVAATGARISALLLAGWLVAVALIGVAIAGPHLRLWVPAKDGSVFICVDTSGSMASTDVTPTRADAAKAAAQAFIRAAPAGVKIGIIAFATSAAVVQPLTADRSQIAQSMDQIPMPNGATAIGDALALAEQSLPPRGHRVVVLVTDGVNNRGADPTAVAQDLAAHHIPVYTVGIGTNSGALVPGTNQPAGIDEGALRGYSDATGGAYARAADASQLRQALARLGRTTTFERRAVDASLPAAAIGGALMLVMFLAGFALGRFP